MGGKPSKSGFSTPCREEFGEEIGEFGDGGFVFGLEAESLVAGGSGEGVALAVVACVVSAVVEMCNTADA